jgi:hypothetical protein
MEPLGHNPLLNCMGTTPVYVFLRRNFYYLMILKMMKHNLKNLIMNTIFLLCCLHSGILFFRNDRFILKSRDILAKCFSIAKKIFLIFPPDYAETV